MIDRASFRPRDRSRELSRRALHLGATALLVACGVPADGSPAGTTPASDTTATDATSTTADDEVADGESVGPSSADESAGSEDSGGPAVEDTGDSGVDPGSAYVPDGVLFFDGFDYLVERDADGKFGADGSFGAHGWSWGKDAVIDGPGAGGWLYTSPTVPGDATGLPGVDSTHVLCVEAKAGTYANVVDGVWRQTDFYLQYGDVENGPLDTIPPDVWFQQWIYVADTPDQPSLFPPTNRLGKWFYPTRNGYPSTDLEWLYSITGVLIDSEVVEGGSSAHVDVGFTSLGSEISLTDIDGNIFNDGRPYATSSLGHSGTDSDHQTVITANQWWLMRLHIDHTVDPGVAEVWIRPHGGDWVQTVDSVGSPVVEWNPQDTTSGHRGLRFPTTMSNWYHNPEGQTTHGDWWIYVDDFAIARGVHAGGNGEDDLPQYPW